MIARCGARVKSGPAGLADASFYCFITPHFWHSTFLGREGRNIAVLVLAFSTLSEFWGRQEI